MANGAGGFRVITSFTRVSKVAVTSSSGLSFASPRRREVSRSGCSDSSLIVEVRTLAVVSEPANINVKILSMIASVDSQSLSTSSFVATKRKANLYLLKVAPLMRTAVAIDNLQ